MHKSVLLNECIENLNIKENGVYVDATLGYAGHSSKILEKIKKGHLYAFDQDEDAIKSSSERLNKIGSNYEIIKSNFANIKEELAKRNVYKVDGILFDLGVSSPQLDEGNRGFSYHKDARLDMRMDKSNSIDAYYIVNNYTEFDLARIIRDYGEEKYYKSIARNIIKYRNNKNIETTLELVEIIKSSMPMKALRESHPAKRTFQAIRIEVNKELEVLESAINSSIELLDLNGRLCVITFQSLEDKIVKNIIKKYSEVDPIVKYLPVIPEEYLPGIKVINRKILPSKQELEENNRARSAKLIVIEKIKR